MNNKDLKAELYMKYHGTIREDLERAIRRLDALDNTTVEIVSPEEIEKVEGEQNFDLSQALENIYQELGSIKKGIDYNTGVTEATNNVLLAVEANDSEKLDKSKSKLMVSSQQAQAQAHALTKLIKETILRLELAVSRGYFLDTAPIASELEALHDDVKLLELHLESQRNLISNDVVVDMMRNDIERGMEH